MSRLLGPRTVTVTSKGQITIPVVLARKWRLRAGDPLWCEVKGEDLIIAPMRVSAARFDAACKRFSVRCTATQEDHELGVLANFSAARVARLTQQPRLIETAKRNPNRWVAIGAVEGGQRA